VIDRADDGIGAGGKGRCDDEHQGETAHRAILDARAGGSSHKGAISNSDPIAFRGR
jgi:hypothetical protein